MIAGGHGPMNFSNFGSRGFVYFDLNNQVLPG